MNGKTDFASSEVVNCTPGIYDGHEEGPFPDELIGATILFVGRMVDRTIVEGGGLVIDFLPRGVTEARRLVIGSTELGAWIEYLGPRANQNAPITVNPDISVLFEPTK